MTQLRLLHVIPSIAVGDGGPSKAIAIMERALTAAGISVTTATTDHGAASSGYGVAASNGENGVNGATRVYVRKWLDFYKVAPGMVPYLWGNIRSFDVVHIHALFSFTSLVAALIARMRRVPYVVRPLGTLASYGMTQRRPWLKDLSFRIVEGPLLRHAAAVHFTSHAEQDETRSLGVPIRGAVIPLGVEPGPAGDIRELVQRHPILASGPTLLYLSRLDRKKNMEGLLQAFSLLKAQRKDLILMIAGSGPVDYVARLKSLSASMGLASDVDVVWLGHIDGDAKAAAFAATDLFVLPSFSENFGIAVVEALFAGLPCVLGEGVAIAQNVQQANAGLAVAPEPAALAEAIERLLGDNALRHEMRANARQLAERDYSTKSMAERLIALYEEIRTGRLDIQA